MSDHLPRARESAQLTYDRRRARSAAETLATIPPNRWDDRTRQIVATLATISSPSRIDDLLEAFDGEPADTMISIDGPYDPGPVPANYDMPSPYEPIMYAPAGEQQRPRPEPYPQPRPRPNPDPRPRPEPHPRPQPRPSLTHEACIPNCPECTAEERASVAEAAERNAR